MLGAPTAQLDCQLGAKRGRERRWCPTCSSDGGGVQPRGADPTPWKNLFLIPWRAAAAPVKTSPVNEALPPGYHIQELRAVPAWRARGRVRTGAPTPGIRPAPRVRAPVFYMLAGPQPAAAPRGLLAQFGGWQRPHPHGRVGDNLETVRAAQRFLVLSAP